MNKSYYTYRICLSDYETVRIERIDPEHNRLGERTGKFSYNPIKDPEIAPILQAANDGILDDSKKTILLGEALFDALFDDSLVRDFADFYDSHVRQKEQLLRVELDIDEEKLSDVAALPWEFMCLPERAKVGTLWFSTAPNVVLSRRRAQYFAAKPIPLKENEKLRIALVISAPKDLNSVEYEDVKESLKQFAEEMKKQVELLPVVNLATPDAIDDILAKGKPHIFHFIGHGRLQNEKNEDVGEIALVNDLNKVQWYDARDFSELFNQHQPGIVVLQSCEGGKLSSSRAFAGVASRIVQQTIPVVLAMQYEVSNGTAIDFAKRFYQKLAEGEPVDVAAQLGRRIITQRPARYRKRDFATPIIFMQVRDGHLFQRPVKEPVSSSPNDRSTAEAKAKLGTIEDGDITLNDATQRNTPVDLKADLEANTVKGGKTTLNKL